QHTPGALDSARQFIAVDGTRLHDKLDSMLEYGDIFQRVAIHHDQVRELAWLQRSDVIENAGQPRGFARGAANGMTWRHTVAHHERQFERVFTIWEARGRPTV